MRKWFIMDGARLILGVLVTYTADCNERYTIQADLTCRQVPGRLNERHVAVLLCGLPYCCAADHVTRICK